MESDRAAQYQASGSSNHWCSYVDFAPQMLEPWGMFSSPKFERFDVLIQRANQWLQQHSDVRVKTCESIEVKERGTSNGAVDTAKSTYWEPGNSSCYFVRCLRLWIIPRAQGDTNPPQQLGYLNVIPACTDPGGVFSSPQFETFGQTINQVNQMMRNNPLPGRILTVETQDMKFKDWGSGCDPDKSFWREYGSASTYFLNVIRIFYESGPPAHEQIGCADFVPTQLQQQGFFQSGEFEPLSHVAAKANAWISQNPGLNIINIQSIDYKLKQTYSGTLDSQRSLFREAGNVYTYYVRIIRVCYSQSEVLPPSSAPPVLSYRTFMPAQVTTGGAFSMPQYEPMNSMMTRISAWFQYTRAHVISAETVPVRMYSGHQHNNPEQTYTFNPGKRSEQYVYCLRFFLAGSYNDPPPQALPPPPQIQQSGDDCCTLL